MPCSKAFTNHKLDSNSRPLSQCSAVKSSPCGCLSVVSFRCAIGTICVARWTKAETLKMGYMAWVYMTTTSYNIENSFLTYKHWIEMTNYRKDRQFNHQCDVDLLWAKSDCKSLINLYFFLSVNTQSYISIDLIVSNPDYIKCIFAVLGQNTKAIVTFWIRTFWPATFLPWLLIS